MSKYGHRPHNWFEAIVNKLGGEEGAEAFLRDELIVVPKPKLSHPTSLADFFTTRPGLWVSDEFRERILAPALEMEPAPAATVGMPFNLPKDMRDAEIRKELGGNHVFEDTRSFCLYLVGALERQWGGVEGDLLNSGYANIFYVRGRKEKGGGEVFTVYVRWRADHGRWSVDAYRLDGDDWRAGRRAFPSLPAPERLRQAGN